MSIPVTFKIATRPGEEGLSKIPGSPSAAGRPTRIGADEGAGPRKESTMSNPTSAFGVTVGDRIELVYCADPLSRIEPGSTGEVFLINDDPRFAQICVKWDEGTKGNVNLIPHVDRFKVIEDGF
jgi:hypothetical protein